MLSATGWRHPLGVLDKAIEGGGPRHQRGPFCAPDVGSAACAISLHNPTYCCSSQSFRAAKSGKSGMALRDLQANPFRVIVATNGARYPLSSRATQRLPGNGTAHACMRERGNPAHSSRSARSTIVLEPSPLVLGPMAHPPATEQGLAPARSRIAERWLEHIMVRHCEEAHINLSLFPAPHAINSCLRSAGPRTDGGPASLS